MARRPLPPGTIGSITWERRSPGTIRGYAWTRDGAGMRRKLSATFPHADDVEADLHRQARALVYSAEEWSPSTLLEHAVDRWFDTQGKPNGGRQAPQTVEIYRRVADAVVIPRLGKLPVSQITAPRVHTLLDGLRVEPQRARRAAGNTKKQKVGYSVSYRLLALHVIKKSMTHAVKYGAIPFNPILSVEPPVRVREDAYALDRHQVAVLRDCVRAWETKPGYGPPRGPQLRLAIELGLATGARIGEVAALLLAETSDLPEPMTAITGTAIHVDGKLVRSKVLKAQEEHRRLTLPKWASSSVAECRRMAVRTDAEATLIQGRTGGMLAPSKIRSDLRKMAAAQRAPLEAAGIDLERLKFHTLRHTVLTAIKERTGDLEIAQAQAGHASTKTTAGYIAGPRVLPVVTGASEAIEGAFGPAA